MLFLPEIELNNNVFCFTTSVQGGVSNGVYKSFNIGDHVGDNKDRVATNRHLLKAIITQQVVNRTLDADGGIEIAPIKWLRQGHSSNIVDYDEVNELVSESDKNTYIDGVDTLSTYTPLAIMTADCLPIVFACTKTGKIAAVHVGWRGLVDDFLAKVVDRFEDANALNVWIGPHISQKSFQVSADIIKFFSPYSRAVKSGKQNGKFLVNLAEIACIQLNSLGVKNIQVSTICTYANQHCFSHRKSTQNGQLQSGRMATVVIRL